MTPTARQWERRSGVALFIPFRLSNGSTDDLRAAVREKNEKEEENEKNISIAHTAVYRARPRRRRRGHLKAQLELSETVNEGSL